MATHDKIPKLNKLVHERARLMILTYLASKADHAAAFTVVKEALGFTAGNLSSQIKMLEEAGYIRVNKSFQNNKPLTTLVLSAKGHTALESYLNEMDTIINSFKDDDSNTTKGEQ